MNTAAKPFSYEKTRSHRPRRLNKLAQDMTTPTSRVFWTDDERKILVEACIEDFKSSGKPYDQWQMTHRLIMKVQLEYLPEGRFRHVIQDVVVNEFQKEINDYVHRQTTEGVLEFHREFVKTHGMTFREYYEKQQAATPVQPVVDTQKVTQLEGELARLKEELDLAALAHEDLRNQALTLTAERDQAVKNYGIEQTEVARLKAQIERLEEEVQELRPPPPEVKGPKLLIVAALHDSNNALKDKIQKLAVDVSFIEQHDNPSTIAGRVRGRIAFILEGHLPKALVAAIRKEATDVVLIGGGGTALVTAIERRIAQEAVNRSGAAKKA